MNCPNDYSYLEPDYKGDESIYRCPTCAGFFTRQTVHDENHLVDLSETSLDNNQDHYYHCPEDQDLMLLSKKDQLWHCPTCLSLWTPGGLQPQPIPANPRIMAGQVVGLFVLALILSSWQIGSNTSSANVLDSTLSAPLQYLSLILWVVTFVLIFLVPLSIFLQLVHSDRPFLKKVINRPLVKWLPIFVILLITINIYFLTP